MSLTELVAAVEADGKTLTVFNPERGVVNALRTALDDRNVEVVAAEVDGPRNFGVLGDGDEFLTAASIDDLLGERDPSGGGFVGGSYGPILDHLDETTFTAYDRRKMFAASREIEDRAWRTGSGELHAGFQTLSNFATQADAYGRLGSRDGLTVHVYAAPDGDTVDCEPVRIHAEPTEEIRRTWFAAYDGGTVEENACALVAVERVDGFDGFWTYDPGTVDYVFEHLCSTYASVESAAAEEHRVDRPGEREADDGA